MRKILCWLGFHREEFVGVRSWPSLKIIGSWGLRCKDCGRVADQKDVLT